ncbi:MAG: hypothetical protein ACHQF2_06085, partial [Flavobacteriales bacterium]
MKKLYSLIGMLCLLTATAHAQYYQVEKQNGKYGLKDPDTGKWKIKPVHEYLCPINDTLFIAGTGGTPQPFERVSYQYHSTENGWENGTTITVVDTIISQDTVFAGLKVGVIHVNGKTIIPFKYSYILYHPSGQTFKTFKGGTLVPGKGSELNNEVSYLEYEAGEMNNIKYDYYRYANVQYVRNAVFDLWYDGKCKIKDVDSITPLNMNMEMAYYYRSVYKKGVMTVYTSSYTPFTAFDFATVADMRTVNDKNLVIVKDKGKFRFKNEKGKDYLPFAVGDYYIHGSFFIVNRDGKTSADTVVIGETTAYESEQIVKVKSLKHSFYGGVNNMLDYNFKPSPDFDSISFPEDIYNPGVGYYYGNRLYQDMIPVYKKGKMGLVNLITGAMHVKPDYDIVESSGYEDYFTREDDRRFLVKKEKKHGMLSWIGDTVLIPVSYDSIIRHHIHYFVLKSANRYTMMTDKGLKLKGDYDSIVPWKEKEFRDAYGYYERPDVQGCFNAYNKGNVSFIDSKMRLACDSLSDWTMHNDSYDYRSCILLTKKSGLTGAWDLSRNEWITKPCFDFRSAKHRGGIYTIYKKRNNDTLVGLLNSAGEIIRKPEFKSFDFLAEWEVYQGIYPDGKIVYFKETGEQTPDLGSKIELSMLPFLKNAASKRLTASNWKSLNGPAGADATAFYIDKKGNYWLGTGSSGGVYFSSDKGNTWSPRLKGSGPVHVLDLHVFIDCLILLDSFPGDVVFVFRINRGCEFTVVDYYMMFLWVQVLQR